MPLSVVTPVHNSTLIKLAEDIDIYEVFAAIEAAYDTCFLMESLDGPLASERYAIIGFGPDKILSATDKTLFVDGKPHHTGNPYFALRQFMPEPVTSRRYIGGLVGYLGYDAVNYFEPALHIQPHTHFPAFMFGVYNDGLIYDTLTSELFYFTRTIDRSQECREFINRRRRARPVDVTFRHETLTRTAHAAAVEAVKEHIRAGNIFQCEVGFKTQFHVRGDTLAIYEKLRTINPSPYMYYLKFGNKKLIGASPELLFSLHGTTMTTRPLAGTVRRGANEAEDRQLARKLLNDPKENAEHNMLVDLHRNDIGRVAQFGSVRVPGLKYVKRFSHVQHIESEVIGTIRPDTDMFSALASNFPAGTLSGAPKIEAMKIINASESAGRGPYGGGVGYFGFNGDCSFSIAIRSLFVHGNEAYAQTSSGIVYDSNAAAEYEEIQRKFAAMKKVLDI